MNMITVTIISQTISFCVCITIIIIISSSSSSSSSRSLNSRLFVGDSTIVSPPIVPNTNIEFHTKPISSPLWQDIICQIIVAICQLIYLTIVNTYRFAICQLIYLTIVNIIMFVCFCLNL